ncbi:MAG: DUF1446 domain-containing protein [Rhodobacteraceae bacterium]|nr:DUF1446 domain-containing protein [Paracoccaceae bacterium]
METKPVVIGGASGFWGEAAHATEQLLNYDGLDFLVYDYLAEITMSILARAKAKNPELGYATDFVTAAMAPNLARIAQSGVRVVSNAGGLNPGACAAALERLIADAGIDLKVAVVEGDDLLPQVGGFQSCTEMFTEAPFPQLDKVQSVNAYLGAFPIAAALDAGADIVITGRCVDSAVTLAACIHHFGWSTAEFDLLAAGSLAGHLLECGPQATGGNFTDWENAGDIAEIGYPIAEVSLSGDFVITKPKTTAGVVSRASIAEQMLYETGDPQCYLLPDVIVDFSEVTLRSEGPDRVLVQNVKGRAPGSRLKVSATYRDGYRAGHVFNFNGARAREKALRFGKAGLDRAKKRLSQGQVSEFSETCIEVFGGFPADPALPEHYEEVTLKVAVKHQDTSAVGTFLKELVGLALAAPPGLSGFTGAGRPKPSPVIRLFSFLIDKRVALVRISMGGRDIPCAPMLVEQTGARPYPHQPPSLDSSSDRGCTTVPLERLAWARSGDKGDIANIGVIARHPEYLPWIWQALDETAIRKCFASWLKGEVTRFFLPGTHSMNILMTEVLGGGGIASLLNDPQAKGYAQRLLALPISVPKDIFHPPNKE